MRLLLPLASFAFTILLALMLLTYCAIYFPATLRGMLEAVRHSRDWVLDSGLPGNATVWAEKFLQPNQIVLAGFAIAMRFAIELVRGLFAERYSAQHSPFSRWG